jgi:hypothetical protein
MKEHQDIEDVLQDFAAKIANQQDNPKISTTEVEKRTKEAASKIKNSLKLKEIITNLKKPYGRGGFGQGKPDDSMYLKDLQRNRILKKTDLILDKLGDMEQIVHLLVEQLQKLK